MIHISGTKGFIGKKLVEYAECFAIPVNPLDYCQIKNKWHGLCDIKKGDLVIHAGAHSSRSSFETEVLSKNLVATYLLARAISTSKARLIFFSAASVTPKKGVDLINCNTAPEPIDPYSWSKFACESILNDFIGSENLITIRLPAIYSTNFQGSGILHKWRNQAMSDGVIKIENIESKINCFYTREHLVKFIFNLIDHFPFKGKPIYMGCNSSASIIDIAKYFSHYSHSKIEINNTGMSGNYLLDISDALSMGMTSISAFDVIDHFFKDPSPYV